MSNRAERRRAMNKKRKGIDPDPKSRTGPLIVAALGIIGGAVFMFTHGASVGGPIIAGGIILPIAWTVLSDPPSAKGNADDAAALKFGK